MLWADAVQMKGLGAALFTFRYSVIAASRSGTLRKTPRRMRFSVISRNQRSTRLSQEDEVGNEVHRQARMLREPGLNVVMLVGGVVVHNKVKGARPGRFPVESTAESAGTLGGDDDCCSYR